MDPLLPAILAALLAQAAPPPPVQPGLIVKPTIPDPEPPIDPKVACTSSHAPRPVTVAFSAGIEPRAGRPDEGLRTLVQYARDKGCKVQVDGFSDGRGAPQRKQELSIQRANYVRDALALALPSGRVEAAGRGEMREVGVPEIEKRVARVSLSAP